MLEWNANGVTPSETAARPRRKRTLSCSPAAISTHSSQAVAEQIDVQIGIDTPNRAEYLTHGEIGQV